MKSPCPSLCPLNFPAKISMRLDTMNHFHIKVPLLGFKSSITYVTLGKLKQGNGLTQTTVPQWAVLQWWKILHELGKSGLSEKKEEEGKKRKCKLGRLDTGSFPFLSVCHIHLLIHDLSCISVPQQWRNLHVLDWAAGRSLTPAPAAVVSQTHAVALFSRPAD